MVKNNIFTGKYFFKGKNFIYKPAFQGHVYG